VLSVPDFLLVNIRQSSLVDICQNSDLLRQLGELDFTRLTQVSQHVKGLLVAAICLGEVYRDARQEIDGLLKQNTGSR